MAGSSNSFKPDTFRAAIRSAMTMGTPPDTDYQMRFHWNPDRTTAATRDGEGIPFDPTAVITSTTQPSTTVACAVEYLDAAGQPSPFGSIVPSRIRVTLLDEEYEQVKDADYVVIGGDRYLRHHEPPSYGLYEVGVHQILYVAENEL